MRPTAPPAPRAGSSAASPRETTGAITVTTLGTSDPEGITILRDAEREVLGYYTPSGEAMAGLHLGGDRVWASAPERDGDEVVSRAFSKTCFFHCLGANVNGACLSACVSCAKGGLPLCSVCIACAGALGIDCARECS